MGNDNFDKAKDAVGDFADKAKNTFTEVTGKLTGDKAQEARGKAAQFRSDLEDLGDKARDKFDDAVDTVKGTVAGLRGDKHDAPSHQDGTTNADTTDEDSTDEADDTDVTDE